MKQIAYLGLGAWGYCLASLLASKTNHHLTCWTTDSDLATRLQEGKEHPRFPRFFPKKNMSFTTNLTDAIKEADLIVESVTSAGIRPVCQQLLHHLPRTTPLILTSKGIEQNTGKILPEVAIEILGEKMRPHTGFISGPSFAQEVIQGLPTSVVGTGYSFEIIRNLCETFSTPTFRIYPNNDILGVAFGGALKNIIAIACGIAEGMSLGYSAKAALMTRGLHEMRKLAIAYGSKQETIYGLSGMGDLCLTCNSTMSRNFRYGILLAQSKSPEEAQQEIGMVVEGAYTSVSALQLSQAFQIDMPIAETVHAIIYKQMKPAEAVQKLMGRSIKEEHL